MLLHKMKIVDSASCLVGGGVETLWHLLVSCPSLRTSWWNSNASGARDVLLDEFKILYGYNAADPTFFLLNYYVLIPKFPIFKHKIDANPLHFPPILGFFKEKVLIHRAATIANRTYNSPIPVKWLINLKVLTLFCFLLFLKLNRCFMLVYIVLYSVTAVCSVRIGCVLQVCIVGVFVSSMFGLTIRMYIQTK